MPQPGPPARGDGAPRLPVTEPDPGRGVRQLGPEDVGVEAAALRELAEPERRPHEGLVAASAGDPLPTGVDRARRCLDPPDLPGQGDRGAVDPLAGGGAPAG